MAKGKGVLLLTGGPGVGKTTIIKEAARHLRGACGFYTEEIRSGGIRQGFSLITLDGEMAVLAHVADPSPYRVGKYGVDIAALDRVGVAALRKGLAQGQSLVIDEIGKMELFSQPFREAVLETLEGKGIVLGTIMLAPHPWADRVKVHPRVQVKLVTRDNRKEVLSQILSWLEEHEQEEKSSTLKAS